MIVMAKATSTITTPPAMVPANKATLSRIEVGATVVHSGSLKVLIARRQLSSTCTHTPCMAIVESTWATQVSMFLNSCELVAWAVPRILARNVTSALSPHWHNCSVFWTTTFVMSFSLAFVATPCIVIDKKLIFHDIDTVICTSLLTTHSWQAGTPLNRNWNNIAIENKVWWILLLLFKLCKQDINMPTIIQICNHYVGQWSTSLTVAGRNGTVVCGGWCKPLQCEGTCLCIVQETVLSPPPSGTQDRE